MGRRGRDRRRSALVSPQTRQRGGDRVLEEGAVDVAGRGEDEPLRAHARLVERDDVRAPDPPDPGLASLRVPPVRMVFRELEAGQPAKSMVAGFGRLDAEAV